ncbi:MAG: glutamate racemase [Clostridia bacterium]|nr:glutamate racemase [Clostridia bacterium]
MNDLIGFFDSGVGGISVLHTARTLLPRENFFYYGDNGNAPYGNKSLEEIRALCKAGIGQLLQRDVKAIVIACNTATAAYAEILRAEAEIPVIGMEPAIKPAQEARKTGEVLALATQATLSLPKFQRLMSLYGDHVIPLVGEGFVEIVESGKAHTQEAFERVEAVLAPYRDHPIESIVLGCTHYPFLADAIGRCFPRAEIHDGRMGTVQQLRRRLEQQGLLSLAEGGSIEIQTSGGSEVLALMHRLLEDLKEQQST